MITELDVSLPTTTGLAIYPAGATFGPRRLADWEFVWIIEGDSEYTCDGVTVPCPPGSIVLCRAKVVDAFRWDPKKRTRHGYFHFNVLKIPSDWPPQSQWPLVRHPSEGDVLRPLFRHAMAWSGSGNPLLCKLNIAHMMTAFVCGEIGSPELPQDALPEPVERVLEHIQREVEEHPADELTLAELAEVAHVTPEHLCRLFKSAQLHSPVETVRLARLDRAVLLLSRSNYSIGEIARLCGFSTQFHFSRTFKQVYKKSPSALRSEIQNGAIPPLTRLVRWAPRLDVRSSVLRSSSRQQQ
ncbi:MAG TPA: AraC family transcriptional regulator [Planctomycetota bacterium]|nr:AraC family transcriptional regulator [Planctomycetota bacterium]